MHLKEAETKMQWMNKRIRWTTVTKSKLFLYIACFLSGYFFHYFVPPNSRKDVAVQDKEVSNRIKTYNDIDVFLVVLIFSSVNNVNKRDTLRQTWLSDFSSTNDIKYYFAISLGNANDKQKSSIAEEVNVHGDLLIFPNLDDSFYQLTPKLLASFGWLTSIPVFGENGVAVTDKYFKDFKFVLKCDDDSFVRLAEILTELQMVYSGSSGKNLYWGFFDGRAKPKRSGKYKEDQWDICDYYIPYAVGGGYVLSKPLVEYIARNGDHLKQYKSEDVSVGAWLSTYSDLNRVHDTRFDTEYISRGCHQSYLITHKHPESTIRNFYKNLKNTGHLCQKEYKTRMSYVYNWQAVPSKCCPRVNPNIP